MYASTHMAGTVALLWCWMVRLMPAQHTCSM
jgi:hypothetical protein